GLWVARRAAAVDAASAMTTVPPTRRCLGKCMSLLLTVDSCCRHTVHRREAVIPVRQDLDSRPQRYLVRAIPVQLERRLCSTVLGRCHRARAVAENGQVLVVFEGE